MLLAGAGYWVAHLPRGGEVTLALPEGSYRARWYNPRSGAWAGAAVPVEASGGSAWTSPAAPSAEDWVLLLEAGRE